MNENLKISEEAITGSNICKNCTKSILKGNPKHGANFYQYYCGEESNLVETENFVEGIRSFWAEPCSEHNSAGSCGDYDPIT